MLIVLIKGTGDVVALFGSTFLCLNFVVFWVCNSILLKKNFRTHIGRLIKTYKNCRKDHNECGVGTVGVGIFGAHDMMAYLSFLFNFQMTF